MSQHRASPPALPSPSSLSTPEILGSPFQLRKLMHRHSDPQFSDIDLFDAVDMGEHAAWANLDEPIYAEKDFEIYRPPQQQSSLPVYYVKGWLPYSADTLFNTIADVRYRPQWDKFAKEVTQVDAQTDCGSDVVYFAVHLPWPFAKRDYVYQRRTKFFARQNAFVMISQAAQHALAPPQASGVVRVETFTMRLTIRSTATSSCDFYMEYEDDTNFSIPNYAVNWLLSAQVPSFLNELRKACAKYSSFLKTLDEVAAQATPASLARSRAEEAQSRSSQRCEGMGNVSYPEPNSTSSTSGQLRRSAHANNLQRKMKSSSASSASSGRRNLQLHSDGDEITDGELSVSPERGRRRHKFFQRTPRDKSKDSSSSRGSKKGTLKKTHSMNKLFSGNKAFAFRTPSSPITIEGFVVEFRKERIGLHLETDLYSNQVLVAHCDRQSEAASSSHNPIQAGMIVTSVNGAAIGGVASSEVLEMIKNASRPLALGFSNAQPTSGTPKKSKEPQNALKCVFSRDGIDLMKLFRPLDYDTNVGAVLKSPLEGIQVSKKAERNASSGRKSPQARPGSSTHQQSTIIPEGAVLNEIAHCLVVTLPFGEIIHLLSRNSDAKILSFKAGLAITGNRDRDESSRSALSRKLSSVFRWKSSDDSPISSPISKRQSNTGFKSASGTESSSGKSADMISDQDESADNGSRSPRRSDEKKCLQDYSRVKITARNISWAWKHVHLLKGDERVFSAAMLIEKIEAFLMKEHNSEVESATVKAVFNKMHEERDWIEQIKERRTLGVRALHEFNNEEESDWNFAQTYFGVSTHWKAGADGTVWLKLDGLVEGVDIFNTLSVMREIDLFKCWVPFCNQSQLVHKTGYVDVVAYMSIVVPLLKRDAIIRAVGINACYESRCILLLGGSVEDDQLPSNVEAPRLKGWNADRMDMRAFRVLIEPITPTKSRTCIVCSVDPKCPVPKSLLNFSIKKIAGVLLFLLRKEAEKIEKAMQDGTITDHVTRLKEDPDGFYAWLGPLFDRWFEDQQADRLPALLKFPKPSELDVLHEMNRTMSSTSVGASFYSRSSSHASGLVDSVSSPSSRADTLLKRPSQSKLRRQASNPSSVNLTDPGSASLVASGKRTWVDYLYDFGIWPYFLLFIFSHVTSSDSFVYVCMLKFVFTCTCTWFGVPGAYSWQTRQRKRACRELDTLRRRCVMLAAVFDLLNSWFLRVWVNWLLCYVTLSQAATTMCQERSPLEIRESENLWLMASAFTFATVVVGIQVAINI